MEYTFSVEAEEYLTGKRIGTGGEVGKKSQSNESLNGGNCANILRRCTICQRT